MKKILILASLVMGMTSASITAQGSTLTLGSSGAKCWQLNNTTGEKTSSTAKFTALVEFDTTPEVTLTCLNTNVKTSHKFINNIEVNGAWLNLYTAGEGLDAEYIIEVPKGYAIESISALLKTVNNNKSVTWNVREESVSSSAEGEELSLSGLNLQTLRLFPTLADNSAVVPTLWEDFTINVVESSDAKMDEKEEEYEDEMVFTVFDNYYSSVPYRIPAIAKNLDGDLVAVADYRYSGQDIGVATNGKLDLRFRIKDGKTGQWGEVQTLKAAFGTGSANVAFGDPCIVGDRESNRMMVTSCCGNVSFPAGTHSNHQGWARFYSEDGGKTWSDYEDISDQVFAQLDKRKNGPIRSFFIGSGKISQSRLIKVGDYYRLYCAALVQDNARAYCNYVFYSDDFGGTWNLLGEVDDCPVPGGADEPKAEELPNGNVVISSRVSGGRWINVFTYTDVEKGLGTWDAVAKSDRASNGIIASSNSCNGEVMVVPVIENKTGDKMHLILQSVPFGPTTRANVGINYKALRTENDYAYASNLACDWDGSYQVSTATSAYSTMCLDKNNNIAFLMEENGYGAGYDIVYVNISIDEITGGAFSIDDDALTTGIDDLLDEEIDVNAPVVYYDLQGRIVKNPVSGIFIRKQGRRIDKVAM